MEYKDSSTEQNPGGKARSGCPFRNRFSKEFRQGFFVILCSILLLAGSLGFILEYRRAETRLNQIEQKNLSVLAESIDHSMYLLLSRSQNNLMNIAGAEDTGRARLEQSFLAGTDGGSFKNTVQTLLKNQSTLFNRIIVRNGNDVLYSTMNNDPLDYHIRGESEANNYAFAQTGRDTFFLAISTPPSENGLIYTGLIPVEDLYSKMTVESVNDSFWLALYDRTGDLILQNENSYPLCLLMDHEEALARKDGISLLVRCDDEGVRKNFDYMYDTDGDGTLNPILVACIPASLSENRAFAISVNMDASQMQAVSNESMNSAFLFALLLVLMGTILVVLFLHSRKEQEKTDEELQVLREKAELTERMLATQTEVSHHQRMESLGILTAGIAHEFNNLLTPILGHSLMAIQNIDDENSPLFTSAMETYSAAQKAKNLVARISSLTRKNLDNQLQELSVNGLVRSALELTRPSQPDNVECVTDLKAEVMLRCNEVQMHQFLMNLIINAFHAMKEEGGTLTVRTLNDDTTVTVIVSDTGPGIPDAEKEKIFDPFYTTKAPGKGTGLGLALARSAVSSHGGTLTVTDTEGRGATFTAVFPLGFRGEELKTNREHVEHGTR